MGVWRGLSWHRPEVVQALRMTASSLAAFGLASAFGLPQGFWAVITALIVTQGNVGGSLKAAFDRFAGSVCGAVYGGAVAFAIPHGDGALSRAVALVVAVAPLSVLAASSAGFRVAPITAIIVLLGTAGATLGPLGFALDRILEVGLGCAVGLLASVLVVPARASRSLLDAAARVTRLLAQQLEMLGQSRRTCPAGSRAPLWQPPARAWPSWRPSLERRRASDGVALRMGPTRLPCSGLSCGCVTTWSCCAGPRAEPGTKRCAISWRSPGRTRPGPAPGVSRPRRGSGRSSARQALPTQWPRPSAPTRPPSTGCGGKA